MWIVAKSTVVSELLNFFVSFFLLRGIGVPVSVGCKAVNEKRHVIVMFLLFFHLLRLPPGGEDDADQLLGTEEHVQGVHPHA